MSFRRMAVGIALLVSHGCFSSVDGQRFGNLAGAPAPGIVDGNGPEARFTAIASIAVAPDGTVYVADTGRIRRVGVDGTTSTLAGGPVEASLDGTGGPMGTARFGTNISIALDGHGALIVRDGYAFRRVNLADGSVTTVARLRHGRSTDDGPVDSAGVSTIVRFAVDPRDGSIVFSDADTPQSDTLRRLDLVAGTIATITNGAGSHPTGLAIAPDGTIFLSAVWAVFAVSPQGAITVVAGMPGSPGDVQGNGTDARFYDSALARGADGTLFLLDRSNGIVRKISPSAVVTNMVRDTSLSDAEQIGVDASGRVVLAYPTLLRTVR